MEQQRLFQTEDLAARSFGCEAMPLTAADARERGAVLYPVFVRFRGKDGRFVRKRYYTYAKIFTGAHNNVVADVVLRYLFWFLIPKRISFLHTHPACTGHKPEAFSVGDELAAKLPGVNFMYLASPGGNLYKYDGKKNAKRDANGVLILEKIYDNMPKALNRIQCKKTLPKRLSKAQTRIITQNNTAFHESINQDV